MPYVTYEGPGGPRGSPYTRPEEITSRTDADPLCHGRLQSSPKTTRSNRCAVPALFPTRQIEPKSHSLSSLAFQKRSADSLFVSFTFLLWKHKRRPVELKSPVRNHRVKRVCNFPSPRFYRPKRGMCLASDAVPGQPLKHRQNTEEPIVELGNPPELFSPA